MYSQGVPGWDDREHDVKEVVKDGPAIMKRELKVDYTIITSCTES